MNGKRKKYTDRQIRFLRSGYLTMNIRDLTRAFNEQFGTSKTELQIKSTLKNHRIRCGRKSKDRLVGRRLYTEVHLQFIQKNYTGRSVAKMTELFNEHFKINRSRQQIKTLIANEGITSGRTGHFQTGNRPWNYGTKGLTGANSKSFKKGNVPANRRPLWSERVCPKDGFILMKVPETNPYTGFSTRYKYKHVYIWEQRYGPVPEGMVVAFIDGDKSNCELENLMLISRAELLVLNQHGYKNMPDELKPHVLALSKLQVKTWALEADQKKTHVRRAVNRD